MRLFLIYLKVSVIVSIFLVTIMLPVYFIRKKTGKIREEDTIKDLVIKSVIVSFLFIGMMFLGLFAMMIDEMR